MSWTMKFSWSIATWTVQSIHWKLETNYWKRRLFIERSENGIKAQLLRQGRISNVETSKDRSQKFYIVVKA